MTTALDISEILRYGRDILLRSQIVLPSALTFILTYSGLVSFVDVEVCYTIRLERLACLQDDILHGCLIVYDIQHIVAGYGVNTACLHLLCNHSVPFRITVERIEYEILDTLVLEELRCIIELTSAKVKVDASLLPLNLVKCSREFVSVDACSRAVVRLLESYSEKCIAFISLLLLKHL